MGAKREEGFLLEVVAPGGEPLLFTWRGRSYRIHAILSRWRESGGWWQRAENPLSTQQPDDGVRSSWRVEAAPEGAVAIYDLERDEASGLWRITQH